MNPLPPAASPVGPPAPEPSASRSRTRVVWLVLPVLLACVAIAALVHSPSSASGVALVQMGERLAAVTREGGRVESVVVGPGQPVGRGDLLARITPATAAGPEEVRAPRDGVVGDVAVHLGQDVAAGGTVVWLVDLEALPTIVAVFPGRFRAQLEPGMPLQYRLAGIPFAIETTIESVAPPEESLEVASSHSWQGVSLKDGAVLVRARVPSRTYLVDGRSRIYMDGMSGKATVPLR